MADRGREARVLDACAEVRGQNPNKSRVIYIYLFSLDQDDIIVDYGRMYDSGTYRRQNHSFMHVNVDSSYSYQS